MIIVIYVAVGGLMKNACHGNWYLLDDGGCCFITTRLIRKPLIALNTLMNPINLIKTEGLGF